MRIRCPCNKCIINVMCETHCSKFGEFMTPVNKIEDSLEEFFEAIDNKITDGSLVSDIYNFIGEKFIGPTFFFIVKNITGMNIDWKRTTEIDKRRDSWERQNERS